MPNGTIKFYNEAKGYGFILQDDAGGDDLFFHITALSEDADAPSKGQRVTFTIGNAQDGRLRADKVQVIA